MTNFEIIKAMTVEEFAEEFQAYFCADRCKYRDGSFCNSKRTCKDVFMEWLNEKAEEQKDD